MKHFTVNEYLRSEYGEKVYRLSINGGMSCPNRDGTLGTGGCIFCSAGGSGDFATSAKLSITDQIESAKERVIKKAPKCRKFIAYFQAYTNTYGNVDYLKKLFTEAINHPDIVILSIATRPDCLPTEVLDLLEELNQIKPVWVELGLQSIHEKSAKWMRRGYDTSIYDEAVRNLISRGIGVITHLILGLPNESNEDIYESVRHVASLAPNDNSVMYGVKLQLLHILKGTDLATYYDENPFHIYSLEEYVSLVGDCIDILPENVILHRITGDGPKSLLIEPKWSANKKLVLNTMNKALHDRGLV
ncbi:MAG: TIGR01212 family radical SAM protein [Butyrivibrio sp.]|nr:TIGR01212 family radical SAM protein [Butyrivibrio sp.]